MASEQKERLRSEARARRASIPGPLRLKAAEALAGHLPQLLKTLPLHPGAVIGCYLAIGTEINTSPLIRTLQQLGFGVALPRTVLPSAPLDYVEWRPGEPLHQDLLGFPAPSGQKLVEPAALLTPLVAFDRNGGRIGQGAGLFDRTISKMRRTSPRLPVIGIAFTCQEVEIVPFEPHDQPLDAVLTENGLLQTLKTAKELDRAALSL